MTEPGDGHGLYGSTGFSWSGVADQISDSDWGSSDDRPPPEPISLDPEHGTAAPETEQSTVPDASAVGGKHRRKRGAVAYEGKVRSVFSGLIKATAKHEGTAPDSAAMILYSPKIAQAFGDLAAEDPRIARGIDILMEGDSPYLIAAMALAPLLFQVARNHEPVLEPQARGFRIPLLMKKPFRFPIKIGVRLGFFRNWTYEPASIARHVFGNQEVQEAFKRQDITVAWRDK